MYEIGQKVVCVKTHSQGMVKEGETYTIKDIMISPCGCKRILFYVGKNISNKYQMECFCCGKAYNVHQKLWLSAKLFRPIDDIYNEEIKELTEVLNEPVTF